MLHTSKAIITVPPYIGLIPPIGGTEMIASEQTLTLRKIKMAYMVKDKGPYPNLAGEFCDNYHPQQGNRSLEYLAQMKFGKPAFCSLGTSKEMAKRGYVGLYLKEDNPLLSFETPIQTNALQEEIVTKTQI
jgi:hypothetical protein